MIIPAGVDSVELPEAVEPSTCQFVIFPLGNPEYNPDSYAMMLPIVRHEEMYKLRNQAQNIQVMPRFFALHYDGNKWHMWFQYKTDKEYYAKLRYNPPMKEI